MTKVAAIVYKTEELIDCDKTNIREQIEDIFDDADNVKFKEFSTDDSMFSLINSELGNPKVGVTACNILENKYTIYAGYFVDIVDKLDYSKINENKNELNEEELALQFRKQQKNIGLNLFGSQITSHSVTGNLVIVKKNLTYSISGNNIKTKADPDTINRNELVDV